MPHIGEKAQVITAPPLSMSAQTVTLTGSPFTYTAARNGMLFISGGLLSTVQYGRGASLNVLGINQNPIMIMAGDRVVISYLTAPTITFLPTQ